jgi:hypothetical protein
MMVYPLTVSLLQISVCFSPIAYQVFVWTVGTAQASPRTTKLYDRTQESFHSTKSSESGFSDVHLRLLTLAHLSLHNFDPEPGGAPKVTTSLASATCW